MDHQMVPVEIQVDEITGRAALPRTQHLAVERTGLVEIPDPDGRMKLPDDRLRGWRWPQGDSASYRGNAATPGAPAWPSPRTKTCFGHALRYAAASRRRGSRHSRYPDCCLRVAQGAGGCPCRALALSDRMDGRATPGRAAVPDDQAWMAWAADNVSATGDIREHFTEPVVGVPLPADGPSTAAKSAAIPTDAKS